MPSEPAKKKDPGEERWERKAGYVYFIAAGDPPEAIKIGISTVDDIKRRLSTIQSSNHVPLRIIGLVRFEGVVRPMLAAQQRERELHELFRQAQRMRNGWTGCEWFNPTPELLALISDEAQPPSRFGVEATAAKLGPGLGCP